MRTQDSGLSTQHSVLRPRPRRPAGSLAAVPYRELEAALRTESLAAVARRYGVARNTVAYWRRKLQLQPRVWPRPRARPLRLEVLAWLQTQPHGATTPEIARHFARTANVLQRPLRTLEAHGLVTRTLEPIPGRWQTRCRWQAQPGPGDRGAGIGDRGEGGGGRGEGG